jgi:hypothetical protein
LYKSVNREPQTVTSEDQLLREQALGMLEPPKTRKAARVSSLFRDRRAGGG